MLRDMPLARALWSSDTLLRNAVLAALGVAILALTAKVQVWIWPSPVPVTLTTFAVLSIGAAYGARLGVVTLLAYLAIGALGFDVFAGSGGEKNGIAYMLGGTGGYLVGYVLAAAALGHAAARGWDRHVGLMALAMLIGNVILYVPGLLWLSQFASGWQQTLEWGLWPFLIGDALKLALAALLFPAAWAAVRRLRG